MGLKVCVLFENGRNGDCRGLHLFICIKTEFHNDDTPMEKNNFLLFCFCFLPLFRGDRYDALRACIGESLCQKLHDLNVFLVSTTDA